MHYPAQAKTFIIYATYVLNYSIQSVTSTDEFPPRRSRYLIIEKYPREFYSPIADHPAVYLIKQKRDLKRDRDLQRLPLTLHAPSKGFFFGSNLRFGDVNQQLPWFFTRWPREDSFTVCRALGRACRRLSRFCNILLQDLTQLHVKTTRSTKLLSFCRRRLKLSTFLHTVSCNHISFLNTRSQLV